MDSILDFLEPDKGGADPRANQTSDPTTDQTTADEAADVIDDGDDFELPPTRRVNKVTVALSAALLVLGSFVAGVWVQKNHGSTSDATASGLPSGLPPGFQGFGGTRSQGAGNATGGTTPAAGPAVVGQVVSVSGTTVTVRNFGGKLVKVTVPEGTPVTSSTTVPLSALKPGSTVSVVGTSAADGSVTATELTTRTGG